MKGSGKPESDFLTFSVVQFVHCHTGDHNMHSPRSLLVCSWGQGKSKGFACLSAPVKKWLSLRNDTTRVRPFSLYMTAASPALSVGLLSRCRQRMS